jgi:hypothetical protein
MRRTLAPSQRSGETCLRIVALVVAVLNLRDLLPQYNRVALLVF